MQGKYFTNHIQSNMDHIQTLMGNSADFIVRELLIPRKKRVVVFFLEGMVDQKLVASAISSLLDFTPTINVTTRMLMDTVLNVGEVQAVKLVEQAVEHILSGSMLVLLDGSQEGI